MARNYRKEYDNYHKQPIQRLRNAARKRARRKVIREKGEAAVQGRDVDHVDRNPQNNASSNLRIMSKKRNRSRNSR